MNDGDTVHIKNVNAGQFGVTNDSDIIYFSDITIYYKDSSVPCIHNFSGEVRDNHDGTHSYKCVDCGEYSEREKHVLINHICSVYGCVAYPLFETSNEDGDDTIELRKASLGATVAPLGETLSEKYLAAADMKYVSSDRAVDESTCAFKDYTCFFKGVEHGTFPACIDNFWRHICAQDEQMTVFDDENYPQFVKVDLESETFAPLTDTPTIKTVKETFLAKIFRFVKALISQLMALFAKKN